MWFSPNLVQTMLFQDMTFAKGGNLDVSASIKQNRSNHSMIQPVDQINNSLEDTVDGSELLRTICLSLILKSQYKKMEGGNYEELIDVIVSRYSVHAQIPSTLLQGQQRSIYFGISIDGVIICW